MVRLNIKQALEEVGAVADLYFTSRRMPEVPAFAGGLISDWPGWAAQAWGIMRQEDMAVTAFDRSTHG